MITDNRGSDGGRNSHGSNDSTQTGMGDRCRLNDGCLKILSILKVIREMKLTGFVTVQ